MFSETLMTTAKKLVEHCRAGTTREGLKELYDPDAVSVEAMAMPGSGSAETKGVEGIRGKHDWWESSFEVHSAVVDGPYPHDPDRFAVIFELDTTEKASGKRSRMKEVGLYTIDDAGKIVREEFFYTM